MLKANIEMGIASLLSAKQRSLLALLGIVIGIGSVIALVSIGFIYKNEILKQYKELGTDYISISKGYNATHGEDEDTPKIQMPTVLQLTSFVPSVIQVAPMGTNGDRYTYQGEQYSASIIGTTNEFLRINRLVIKEGRFISDLDMKMNYVVIGDELATKMKEKGVTKIIGVEIKMKDTLFTIIGVLEKTSSGGLRPFNANRSLIMPYSTFTGIFDNAEISNILARVGEKETAAQVSEDITNYFKLRAPDIQVEVQNAEEIIAQMAKQMQMITMFLFVVGCIALTVGGIGVMNVMLVSVAERKKEIGIRRAIGALRRDIQTQFLVESIVLCILGGIFGLMAGIGTSYFAAKHFQWEFQISIFAIFLGIGVSTFVGVAFGFFPARQAAQLDPIVALRS